MVNHYLVCPKCKSKTFFGQGYGIIKLRGFEVPELIQFIEKHFKHGIEVLDENFVEEMLEGD
jgi:hypothetical protein